MKFIKLKITIPKKSQGFKKDLSLQLIEWVVFKKTDCWNKKFRAEKKKKSVLGVATLYLDQPGDPPLHGVTEVEEQLLVLTENPPGLPHVEFQLGQVPRWLEPLVEDPLEGSPEVLDGIHVGALSRPVQKSDPLLLKPGHHHP